MTSGNMENEQSMENPVAEVIPLKGWRKALAERMLSSHLTYAEVTQMREIDATELVNLRQSLLGDLEKEYGFENFREALKFTNRVGNLAEAEGHHPDIHLSWGRVRLLIWTHKIDGLTESDFILAAKADALLQEGEDG